MRYLCGQFGCLVDGDYEPPRTRCMLPYVFDFVRHERVGPGARNGHKGFPAENQRAHVIARVTAAGLRDELHGWEEREIECTR